MREKYKLKVEVEFICPTTIKPNDAFSHWFKHTSKTNVKSIKLLNEDVIKLKSRINKQMRSLNERKHIVRTILKSIKEEIKFRFEIIGSLLAKEVDVYVYCVCIKCVAGIVEDTPDLLLHKSLAMSFQIDDGNMMIKFINPMGKKPYKSKLSMADPEFFNKINSEILKVIKHIWKI